MILNRIISNAYLPRGPGDSAGVAVDLASKWKPYLFWFGISLEINIMRAVFLRICLLFMCAHTMTRG